MPEEQDGARSIDDGHDEGLVEGNGDARGWRRVPNRNSAIFADDDGRRCGRLNAQLGDVERCFLHDVLDEESSRVRRLRAQPLEVRVRRDDTRERALYRRLITLDIETPPV